MKHTGEVQGKPTSIDDGVRKTPPFPYGLCHRCEHRAAARETGHGPRIQCADEDTRVACYMYQPVRPLVLIAIDGEDRPITARVAGRAHAKGLMSGAMVRRIKLDGSVVQWWEPAAPAGREWP